MEVLETRSHLREGFLRLQSSGQFHEAVRGLDEIGQGSGTQVKSDVEEIVVTLLTEV